MGLISFLIVGLLAGWLAGNLLRGGGLGLFWNLVTGVVGAYLGAFLFDAIGLSASGFVGNLIMATVGAVVLLWLVDTLKKRRG